MSFLIDIFCLFVYENDTSCAVLCFIFQSSLKGENPNVSNY